MNTVFACDIGGSKLLCGLVTQEGDIIDREKRMLSPDITVEALEGYILEACENLKARNPECAVTACGMTIPGVADARKGMWVYACFSGISDYPVSERMGRKLGLPIAIANDANACAWAERVYGACRDTDDFLWVTVSNGIGGGLVLNGKIYEGAFGGSGEFGHMIIEKDGLLCPCGHRGCMEAMAAGPGIAKRYEAMTGQAASAAQIAELARQGDPQALAIFKKTGEYLGRALGKSASLLNLKKYVLGGGVMQSFDLMEADIWAAFREEAFAAPNREAQIVPTALHYEAALLGAAALAWYPAE